MSDEGPRELFLEAITLYPDVRTDAKRFESLLKDYYQGNFRKESAVLSNCVREGVPDALASVKGGAPYAVVSSPLVRRLVDNWGTTEDIARWAVDSWALALGLVQEADLQPRFQSLSIVSDPPGAKAIVNGQFVGTTPVEITTIAPGTHRVECTRDGHLAATASVEIAQGKHEKLSLTLQPQPPPPPPKQDTATFVVQSDPPGAEVYLDNRLVGTTPLRTTGVMPGSHVIRCGLPGYNSQSMMSHIRALEEKHHSFSLTPLTQQFAEINVLTTPSGCAIHLDGTYAGLSPQRLMKVGDGDHTIKCVHAGYQEEQRSIHVASGKAYRVNFDLYPILQKTYEIAIASRPSRATLYVNQQEVGKTPFTFTTAKPGSVSITCRYPGYQEWHQDLIVGLESSKMLSITLVPEKTQSTKRDSTKMVPPLMPRPMVVTGAIYLIAVLCIAMLAMGLVNFIFIIFALWGFFGIYRLYHLKADSYQTTMLWASALSFLSLVLLFSAPSGSLSILLIGLFCFAAILVILWYYRSYFIE